MSNRKKLLIVLSVFIIILLSIIGITYGYFMTKVNTENTAKVNATLADISIVYKDGTGNIKPEGVLKPGSLVGTKEFSVTNNGNIKFDNYIVYFENVVNPLLYESDLVYSLTCTSSKNNKCNGKEETPFPKNTSVIVYNSIDVTETQNYKLTVTYKDSGKDQSLDMGKTFSGKINITDSINNMSK